MEFKDDNAERLDRTKHGWPVPTGESDKATGASIWKVRLCADASPAEILAYRKVKADQKSGIVCKGFSNLPTKRGKQ
jgi:hypothetical protein